MEQTNVIKQLLSELQASREEWNSLSFQEQRARTKESSINSLLSVGYITPDEAKEYGEPLNELPTDRKGLIVAYLNTQLYRDSSPSIEKQKTMVDYIRSFKLRERGALQGDTTIADVLSKEEQEKFTKGLHDIEEKERIRLAEAYVDTKRRILRKNLIKIIIPELACYLLEPLKKGELDPMPYERDLLTEKGYRFKAKSLNDEDKAAIEQVAEEIADTIELSYLNGKGRPVFEEVDANRDENGNYKEEFRYRDIYDELISGYPIILVAIEETIDSHYTAETAREVRGSSAALVQEYRKSYLTSEQKERLRKSKFACYINE